jgi:ABC-type transport system involved in multi-copper enzyme maturation permease subunit
MQLFADLTTWVTPLWLLSVGITAGALLIVAVYGVLWVVRRPLAVAAAGRISESLLLPLVYLAGILAVFSLIALPVVPYRSLLNAVSRISVVGSSDVSYTIPAATPSHELEVPVRGNELQGYVMTSDRPVTVHMRTIGGRGIASNVQVKLTGEDKKTWTKQGIGDKQFVGDGLRWTATNVGEQPATLRLQLETDIEFPEVRVVPTLAIGVVAFVALYLAFTFWSSKVAAIALTTAREAISQPLFYVVMAMGIVLLGAFIYIPYNTFGEDIKMLKDSGLTLIMVLSIIVAIWSASVSVADEIEGRTALTLLSKPIHRWQFVIGKFLGVLQPVILMFVILGFFFLITVSFKVVYDARESAQPEPMWQACYLEMARVLPGLVLGFYETVVLAAISVALSTRLPMIANLLICASVYVLGNLVPMLVNSAVGKFEPVQFVGQFLAVVLPVLENFNIQPAIAGGVPVPLSYLAWALLYCVLYSTVALLVGLVLFDDRDLA